MQSNEQRAAQTHGQKVEALVEKLKRLRKSLPESMWSAMERRVCAQASAHVATDALLQLEEENNNVR